MPRNTLEPLKEEDKLKQQENQDQELQLLQRQYRFLEKDRKLLTCGAKLNQLNNVLSVFRREHQNIQIDLEAACAPSKQRQNSKDFKNLSSLLNHYDFYNDEVKTQRQQIKEIEGRVRTFEKDVVDLRAQQVSDRHVEQRVWLAVKTVDGLWNKLDVQNKKFGTICAKNRALKAEIKGMMYERDVFMKIWKTTIKKLYLGKKFMMDLIQQATIAYNEREDWCSQLQALRMKAYNDSIVQIQEMRELKRRQVRDKKLADFVYIKAQKRVMKDREREELMKRMENNIAMKARLEEYRKFLDEILDFTKESKMEEIARKYYIQESENLSLFTYVNKINEELEFLGEELENTHNGINEERALNSARIHHQENTIQSLETDIETATQELKVSRNKLQEVETYIQQMLSGIDKLFQICRCDKDPILQLLGDNKSINIHNVFFYVQMIEDKINQALVNVYHDEKISFDKKQISGTHRMVLDKHDKEELQHCENVVISPCSLCYEHDVVSDVIDVVQHVMSRRQAKISLEQRLQSAEFAENTHNVSICLLPKSRSIIQKRYQ